MTAGRILCVDDEEPARRLARRLLEPRGYVTEEAGDLAEARRRLARADFDLVLLDVTMPGGSGLELLRYLTHERPDVAAVMVTARDAEETAVAAVDLGAYGYVIKPYEPNELVVNVVNALRRLRVAQANEAHRSQLERDLERSRGELRESEERFRAIVSNLPGALFRRRLDEAWTLEFASDALEEVTGYAPGRLVGSAERTFVSIVHPDDLERVEGELRAAVESDGSFSLAYRVLDAAGQVRWVGERGRAVTADGTALDGVISDITERKRIEQERDRMESELRIAQRFEAVGQLAAGIAHEINTPVQFVSDSVQFLQSAFHDLRGLVDEYRNLLVATGDAEAVRRADAADEAADVAYLDERVPPAFSRTTAGLDRVAEIVRAMKSFGHVAQTEKAPTDLNDVLETTLIVASNELKYVADVETDLGPLPPVICNGGELGQVFLNLLVNAAHAIEDAGRERGSISVVTRRDGQEVIVSVSDTGCGIAPAIRERIFDPFFTTKEVGRGSGQGLALARSIVVDGHGGAIGCESEVGEGTTITLRVPIGGDG